MIPYPTSLWYSVGRSLDPWRNKWANVQGIKDIYITCGGVDSFTKYWISTLRGEGSDPSQITWALNFWEVSRINSESVSVPRWSCTLLPFASIFHMWFQFHLFFFFLSIFSFLFIFQWVLENPNINWVCVLSFLIEILQCLWDIIVDSQFGQGLKKHSRFLKVRDCYWGMNDATFSGLWKGSKYHCNLILKFVLDLKYQAFKFTLNFSIIITNNIFMECL